MSELREKFEKLIMENYLPSKCEDFEEEVMEAMKSDYLESVKRE